MDSPSIEEHGSVTINACPNCGGSKWRITRIDKDRSDGSCGDCQHSASYSTVRICNDGEEKHEISDLVPTPNRRQRRAMKSKKGGGSPAFSKGAKPTKKSSSKR